MTSAIARAMSCTSITMCCAMFSTVRRAMFSTVFSAINGTMLSPVRCALSSSIAVSCAVRRTRIAGSNWRMVLCYRRALQQDYGNNSSCHEG